MLNIMGRGVSEIDIHCTADSAQALSVLTDRPLSVSEAEVGQQSYSRGV